MDRMAYAIASQTTVEAEPVKHGEWNIIECDKENGRVVVECECGAVFKLSMFEFGLCYNYCPNCGARMDGKKIATDCTICGHTNCVSDSVCKICGVKYAEC